MKKIVAFGELLVSLGATGRSRLVQAESFAVRYTGAEANTAVSLAQFGLSAFVVSKVPTHEIGQACVNALRRFGVNTDHVVRGGDRLGLLYLEQGASQRATKVIYDRVPSSFRQLRPDDLDWNEVLADKDWLYFSGTAAALGPAPLDVLRLGLDAARRRGVKVACDCNYRSKLWSKEDAGRTLTPLLEYVDVLICGKDDPAGIFGLDLDKSRQTAVPEAAYYHRAAESLRARHGLDAVAMTFRDGPSASVNRYSAMLCHRQGVCRSREYEIQIVDRVGAGDAFCAGLLFGLASGLSPQRTIDFAAAAAALRSGKISAAALDVTDPEPPDLQGPLVKLDNVVNGVKAQV